MAICYLETNQGPQDLRDPHPLQIWGWYWSLCRRAGLCSLMRATSNFFILFFFSAWPLISRVLGSLCEVLIVALAHLGDHAPRGAAPGAINSFYKRLNAPAEPKHLDNCKSHLLTPLRCPNPPVSDGKKQQTPSHNHSLSPFLRVLGAFAPVVFLQQIQITFFGVDFLRKEGKAKLWAWLRNVIFKQWIRSP